MIDSQWFVLAFDTETDGLPPSRCEDVSACAKGLATPDGWPRVLQLAWVVLDRSGRIVHKDGAYILPADRSPLNERATAIHGITMDTLLRLGQDGDDVLRRFAGDVLRARLCVAHNAPFDISMIHGECARRKIPYVFFPVDPARLHCTMKLGARLFGKRMRLTELYKSVNRREREFVSQTRPEKDAHDAMWDAECAARIARKMCRMGICRSPAPC
jgi:DNA polymerase III epsilon subunit-like protein